MLDSSLIETEQSHTQSFSTSHGGLEEDKDQPMMSTPTSSSKDGFSYGCLCTVSLVEVHSLAVVLLLLIRRCAGDGPLIFLL